MSAPITGITRVILEFAKHIVSFKNVKFFYRDPGREVIYCIDDAFGMEDLENFKELNISVVDSKDDEDASFLDQIVKQSKAMPGKKAWLFRKVAWIRFVPGLNKLFAKALKTVSKRKQSKKSPNDICASTRNLCLCEVSAGVGCVVEDMKDMVKMFARLFGDADYYNMCVHRIKKISHRLPNVQDTMDRIVRAINESVQEKQVRKAIEIEMPRKAS